METMTLGTSLSGKCETSDIEAYTFTATADLSVLGPHTVQAWISLAGDANPLNDTLSVTVNNLILGGTIPFSEGFENGLAGWEINNTTNGANAGTWVLGTPAKVEIVGAAEGDSCLVNGGETGTYNAAENSWVESPCYSLAGATGQEWVAMKINVSTENSWDGANLFASYDGGTTWGQVGTLGSGTEWYDDNSISGAPNGSQEGWTGDFA